MGMAGPHVAVAAIACFCRLIGPPLYVHVDAAESARGTAARHRCLQAGDVIPGSVPRRRAGSIRPISRSQRPRPSERVVEAKRVGPGGNPYSGPTAKEATLGFACLLACGRHNVAVRDIAQLRRLTVHDAQSRATASALWPWLAQLQARVDAGEALAVQCGCEGVAQGTHCHCQVICAHVEQQLDIAEDVAQGPPPDPVCSATAEVVGLDLEPAKLSKWYLGGAAVWIGIGMSATLLVTWVPMAKAAVLLQLTNLVLDELCTVAVYRSYVGALQDTIKATGGGWYRMHGMFAPLREDAELGQGPATIVRLRKQMKARLLHWLRILANRPGASMVAAVGPVPLAPDALIWEIGGDAAREGLRREGLGAFWYGIWWCVPLTSIDGLAALHITCLELIEIGLGVVIVGPFLDGAQRVRAVSDALAAVLTIRARKDTGALARDVRASALVAAHEVIMKRPEWIALHEPVVRLEVAQNYGETLLLHDAASRHNEGVIEDVCKSIGIIPRRLDPLPPRAQEYLRDVVAAACDAQRAASELVERVDTADPVIDRGPLPYGEETIRHVLQRLLERLCGMHSRGAESVRREEPEPPLISLVSSDLWAPRVPTPVAFVCTEPSLSLAGPSVRRGPETLSGTRRVAGTWAPRALAPAMHYGGLPLAAGERGTKRGPETILVQEAGVRAQARAARLAAPCLREGSSTSAGVVLDPRVVRGPAAPAACVKAVRASGAPSLATALQSARERLTTAAAKPVLALASRRESDQLQEVRELMVERSMQSLALNEDGLGVTGQVDDMLRGLLAAAHRAFERRFAKGTNKQDTSYWSMWCEWCRLLGTPPLRSNAAANSGGVAHLHQREVAIALGAFMSWVLDNPQFKISSMLQRLRGVARRHKSVGLTFVSLSMVVMAAEGLIQAQIDTHGADSLLPKSKEPLTFGEISAMLLLPEGTAIGNGADAITVGDINLEWQGVRTWIALLCTGGFRKEAVALGPEECAGPRKLTLLHSITYRRDGVVHRAPTLALLLTLAALGTVVYITPCPCKNDPKGDKFGNSPVPSAWHPTRTICFAREIIRYELMRRVAAGDRRTAPLILGPRATSWSKARLDHFFKGLLALIVSKERAKQLSIHSFRVWLACSLLAAGATPEQIMLLLRWSSDAARKLYARVGERVQISFLNTACDVPLDSVRSHTLFASAGAAAGDDGIHTSTSTSTPMSASTSTAGTASAGAAVMGELPNATQKEAADAVETALRLISSAHAWRGATPSAVELPCSIDDDEEHRRLQEAVPLLRIEAARADARMMSDANGEADASDDDA